MGFTTKIASFRSTLFVFSGILALTSFARPEVTKTGETPGPAIGNSKQAVPVANLSLPGRDSLLFIENRGQFDQKVRYYAKMGTKSIWFTEEGPVFDVITGIAEKAGDKENAQKTNPFRRLTFGEHFKVAAVTASITACGEQPGTYNFFRGNNPAKWVRRVRSFSELVYHEVWPGIDVRFRAKGGDLEQEFIVHPGSDPSQIQVRYEGIEGLSLSGDGSLVVSTAFGDFAEKSPILYQEVGGKTIERRGKFALLTDSTYKFQLGDFNHSRDLIIDPTLLYSTYLGGTGSFYDIGDAIAADAAGNAYVYGTTDSSDFPTTTGAFNGTASGNPQYFVVKLSPAGLPIFSTFLANTNPNEGGVAAAGIAVSPSGAIYLVGQSGNSGPAFPTTANAYQQYCLQSNFLTVLAPAGDSLVYSTCLGGPEVPRAENANIGANAVAVDRNGRAYVAGTTGGSVPTTPTAFQSQNSGSVAFLTVIDPSLSGSSSLVYSTLLGGSRGDFATAVAVDLEGNAYLTGTTGSYDFPITAGALDSTNRVGYSVGTGFVAKINPNASGTASLIYSTYLGGSGGRGYPAETGDNPTGIAVDAAANAYVVGSTASADFPTTVGSFEPSLLPGNIAGFVTKINAGGSHLIYSSLINESYSTNGIALDASGNAYVVGSTVSNTLPVSSNAFQSSNAGQNDAYLLEFNANGSGIVYGSYLGGEGSDFAQAVAIDTVGDIYLTGGTSSSNFPVTPSAFRTTQASACSAIYYCHNPFVAKFPLGASPAFAITDVQPRVGGNGGLITATIVGSGFHSGLLTSLDCGGNTIVGSSVVVAAQGRYFMASFDLRKVSPGTCSLQVKNLDGTTQTSVNAFRVEGGGGPSLSVEILSPRAVRPGTPYTFYVLCRNTGNTDQFDIPIFIHLPLGVNYLLPSSLTALVPEVRTGTGVLLPLWIYKISASSSITIPLTITPPASLNALPITVEVFQSTPTEFSSSGDTDQISTSSVFQTLRDSTASAMIRDLGPSAGSNSKNFAKDSQSNTSPPSRDCQDLDAELGTGTCQAVSFNIGQQLTNAVHEYNPWMYVGLHLAPIVAGSVYAAVTATEIAAPPVLIATTAVESVIAFYELWHTSRVLSQIVASASVTAEVTNSIDPNNKLGLIGVGDMQYVGVGAPLAYVISFANEPTATAPAQIVTVNDILSSQDELETFLFGPITIGTQTIVPTAGNTFFGVIDLRPTTNLEVKVTASLDTAVGRATWTFSSVDPSTGLPPTDPAAGFLPPGSGGSVSLTVRPKQTMPIGVQVQNQASVAFDANAPISTQVWSNSLDFTPPVSRVAALPSLERAPNFSVGWSGADVGSGIGTYTIYVSDNGASFAAWQTATTATSATYTGVVGHTYAFYSIASDLVGNVESAKANAEATTTVQGSSPCAADVSSQVNVIQGGFRFNHATNSFAQTVTLTNNGAALSAVSLVLDNLSSAATLTNSGGSTQCDAPIGSPWIAVPGTIAAGQSISVTLNFADPTKAGIKYTTRVLSGPGQQQ